MGAPSGTGVTPETGTTAGPGPAPASGGQPELLEAGPPPRPRRVPTLRLHGPAWSGAGWRWALAAASVLVVAMVIIAALAYRLGAGADAGALASAKPARTPAATPSPLPVTDLFQRVAPSVVLITTSKGALGSGVIVTGTGTVLTADHVVSGGGRISVVFVDGTKAAATISSADPKTDIATLTPQKLPEVVVPSTLGGGVAVGSDVVAIGNPLGLRSSATTGIVSGLNRQTKLEKVGADGAGTLSGLIQFDAAVNPGSSGGPLLDAQGLVVGVVVSIADPGRDDAFAGIGFAVPIGTALGGGAGDGPGGGPRL